MHPIRRAERFLITASHTTAGQLLHRARKIFRQRLVHRTARYRNWLAAQYTGDEPIQELHFPDLHIRPVDVVAIERGEFTFLNRTESLGRPVDWTPEGPAKLWVYNLHYFEYAVSLAHNAAAGDDRTYAVFRDVVSEWIQANPQPVGMVWHAYPVSLRICNWIKAYSLLSDRLSADVEFTRSLRRSILTQARYLEDNLEYDLMNNHLLENGRALFNAGYFFGHRDAERWRQKGRQILNLGLREHFLDDGAHDELSPMYHQIMLELYVEMKALLQQRKEAVPELLEKRIEGARKWLAATVHPDGRIALLNDAAHGIACGAQHLLDVDRDRPCNGFLVLDDSRLASFRDIERGDYLVADNGELGPERLPGHGHCDALSYELSLQGQRIVVDSGVEQYHEDETWRSFYRGTRAHNTVVVDRQEQSEIWGAFRVARRAKPLSTFHGSDVDRLHYWSSAHSGYQRLAGNVVHRRWISWVDRRFWIIADQLTGSGIHHVQNLIHFHPSAEVPSDHQGTIRRGVATLKIRPFGLAWGKTFQGETEPPQGWYAPEFGIRMPNVVWNLEDTVELPIWFGYVLWPADDDGIRVSMAVSDTSKAADASCTVTVEHDMKWTVEFSTTKQTAALKRSGAGEDNNT